MIDTVGQLLFYVIFFGAGALLAYGARDILRHWQRSAGPGLGKLVGRPPSPDWAPRDWLCGDCRSFNHVTTNRCRTCRHARSECELLPTRESLPDDIVPATIDASGRHVSLEHNRAAHVDGLHNHWRLRLDGEVVASASLRTGAAALLRCVHGTDEVVFDPHGRGASRYRLSELLGAFEGPRFPISEPCPEAVLPLA